MGTRWRTVSQAPILVTLKRVWPVFAVHLAIVLTAVAVWQNYFGTLSPTISPRQFGVFIAGLSHWDATWFLEVARSGYLRKIPDETAFFPLYPALMGLGGRLLSALHHGGLHGVVGNRTYLLAGIAISNVAFFGALSFLYQLGRRFYSERQTMRGLWFLALFPSSYYFSAAYSESLFLLCVVAAFWLGYQRRYFWAGLLMGLGALCWDLGIFGVLSLLWLVWRDFRVDRRVGRLFLRAASVSLIPVACLLIYFAWLDHVYKNPLMFLWAEKHHWHRHFAFIWTSLRLDYHYDPVGFLASVTFLIILLASIRRIPLEQWLFSAILLLIPLFSVAGKYPMSMVRFVLMLFPLFLFVGAKMRRLETYIAVIAGSAIFLVWLTGLFSSAHWVA
ncbi:hypothetical protein [Alicyclobacillus ferrooxydans]|uniref:Glycosyltransferase RgtA/B/C/D-like domain-containing protein n=1 Tax=Alicyclobacillus ferrooxydans TaxID=471514 RepID=A0A0P9C6L7_9BACL|nr:hypothetical protein [Alicyclobacillus ferrooxydans]KPV40775.1 hypothetical protein AN477_20880 [Alicyclobacillus ferrooxydans]